MFDSAYGVSHVLMLPDAHYGPARAGQGLVGRDVAYNVPAQFRCPVPLVGCRLAAMYRADVPEAAVNKDSDLAAREDDVGADADPCEVKSVILPEPKASRMQRRPKRDLRLCVRSAVRPHVPRPAWADRQWNLGPWQRPAPATRHGTHRSRRSAVRGYSCMTLWFSSRSPRANRWIGEP